VQLVLRSAVDYTNKTDVAGVALATGWQTYTRLLTAQATLSNARADFEFQANGTVRIDNVRLVRVQSASGNAQPVAFANTTTANQQFPCPVTNTTACTKYVDLRTGSPVSFPLTLAGKTSKVVVLQDPLWIDADRDGVPGDGVAGSLDRCPSTPDGAGVNDQGCSVGQVPTP
jgi:Flp pilus assembly protein TadG